MNANPNNQGQGRGNQAQGKSNAGRGSAGRGKGCNTAGSWPNNKKDRTVRQNPESLLKSPPGNNTSPFNKVAEDSTKNNKEVSFHPDEVAAAIDSIGDTNPTKSNCTTTKVPQGQNVDTPRDNETTDNSPELTSSTLDEASTTANTLTRGNLGVDATGDTPRTSKKNTKNPNHLKLRTIYKDKLNDANIRRSTVNPVSIFESRAILNLLVVYWSIEPSLIILSP